MQLCEKTIASLLLLMAMLWTSAWSNTAKAQTEGAENKEMYCKYSDDGSIVTLYYGVRDKNDKEARDWLELNYGDEGEENWYTTSWSAIYTAEDIVKVIFDPSFKDARPTTCWHWFGGCYNLETIEGIEYLNTEEVTNMELMFSYCPNLKQLDVSKFNTSKVKKMGHMFDGCSELTSLDVSNFDTKNVTDMSFLFSDCTKLTSLDVSNFDVQNATNISGMFSGCTGLTTLDISNFNTGKAERMRQVFEGCTNLTTIYASDGFVVDKVINYNDNYYKKDLFKDCPKLVGAIAQLNGNEDKTDISYANYKTGYFTKIVGKLGNEKIGATGQPLAITKLDLTDDNDFEIYEPVHAKTAIYGREMKTGTTWATLCLPFNVTMEGKNFRAFKLLSQTADEVELEEVKNTIAAGTPVIIKMNDGATNPAISEVEKDVTKDIATGSTTTDGSYKLVGIYKKKVFDKDLDKDCFILKNDKLMNPAKILADNTGNIVGSKAFRAYMQGNGSESGAKAFSLGIGGVSAIDALLETDNDSKAEYYDMQGRRQNGLQKGMNIVKRGSKTIKVIVNK